MSDHWIEVCIRENLDAGELLSRLDDPFIGGAWEDEGAVHLYWPEAQWSEERLASVRQVVSNLVSSNGEVAVAVTQLPSQDWNEA